MMNGMIEMTDLFNSGPRPYIDEYLKKKSEERRDYGPYWSASSAGYCMRKNIFDRLGVPPVEEEPYKTRIFESGHIFHSWVQDITKNAGISIAQELELIDEELLIKGHIDDLLLIDDKLILVDYKTAHSASFDYKKHQPMGYYHTMQLGTYLYMLNKMKPEEITALSPNTVFTGSISEGRILSISKDDLRMDEKQLMYTGDLQKKVYEYWSTLNGYWKSKKLPKCTCLDYDGGFMGRMSKKGKTYNPYWFEGEPCSLKWYNLKKAEGVLNDNATS